MRHESVGPAVLRIELVHVLLVLGLLFFLVPGQYLEPRGLILGGLFMGLNFLLLGQGIRQVLTPFAGKGRVRTGVLLLTLKLIFFLGLLLVPQTQALIRDHRILGAQERSSPHVSNDHEKHHDQKRGKGMLRNQAKRVRQRGVPGEGLFHLLSYLLV